MKIYCCGCQTEVEARLTNGAEIYERHPDLADHPYWICDACGNWVGCHHKVKKRRTEPLGVIPTPLLKNARSHIHKLLDPLWKSGRFDRKEIYRLISQELGYEYHTAEITTIENARKVYRIIQKIADKQFSEMYQNGGACNSG